MGRLRSILWYWVKIIDTVKFLVSQGADVNMKDRDGETPLHNAVRMGGAAMVKFLVSKRADVNTKNDYGIVRQ